MKKGSFKFAEVSLDDIRQLLFQALRARYPVPVNGTRDVWVEEVFRDYIVANVDGKLYKIGYAIDGTDVKLSTEAVEVTEEYVPVVKENAAAFGDFGGQWIEIFRAGDYGKKGTYTKEEIATLAESYDPKTNECPLVVGHPKSDAPAFGWVKTLKAVGEVLKAKFHQVPDKFEAAVKEGRFKKRSVALKRDANGALQLMHVGFLGAMPPEVKALADVKFGDGEYEQIEFTEDNMEGMDKKGLLEALKEFFGGKTVKVFTEDEHKAEIEKATKPLQDKINVFEAAATKQAENVKTFAAKATELVNKLKMSGKFVPAFEKMGLTQIFTALAAIGETITFGEGDKKVEKPAIELFAEFLEGLPKIVPTEAIDPTKQPTAKVVKFNQAPGIELDQTSVQFNEACNARANEKSITFGEAMRQLQAEGWKPAGAAAAGQA